MSDLIDREALLRQIDIDSEGEPGYYGDTWKFIDTIKSMPSAELSTNLAEVGTDCISREAVLNEFCHLCDGWSCNPNTCCKTEWIRKLPPIQPAEPKKGRWIGKYPVTSVCSECGFLIHDSKVKAFAYCPNCGTDMRGEQNG